MSLTRAVLFDADGVLINGWHDLPAKRRRWDTNLEEDMGVRPDDFSKLFDGEEFVNEVLTGRKSLVVTLEEFLPKVGYFGTPMSFIAYWLDRDCQLNRPLIAAIKRLRASSAALISPT